MLTLPFFMNRSKQNMPARPKSRHKLRPLTQAVVQHTFEFLVGLVEHNLTHISKLEHTPLAILFDLEMFRADAYLDACKHLPLNYHLRLFGKVDLFFDLEAIQAFSP